MHSLSHITLRDLQISRLPSWEANFLSKSAYAVWPKPRVGLALSHFRGKIFTPLDRWRIVWEGSGEDDEKERRM